MTQTELKMTEIIDVRNYIEQMETDTVLIVVDVLVWELYSDVLSLETITNKKIFYWKSPQGEKTKTIQEVEKCFEYFLSKGVHRKTHLVAIGGGATSDFAGLVASMILRGIEWSVVPTTLLSMVDAAIGGKVAINSQAGKNLIGAFHLPKTVLMCPQFLDSLPLHEYVSGLGEVFKYTFLSHDIFNAIESNLPISEVIYLCSQYKQDLILKDLYEEGDRIQLNLGHTFGHALELIYEIPHGEAIMWGMVIIFKIQKREDLIELMSQVRSQLKWDIKNPPWFNKTFPTDKIRQYIEKDKKKTSQKMINLIVVDKVGKYSIREMELEELFQELAELAHEIRSFHF